MINDSMWVFFWMLYFERFAVLNGWGRQDVFVLWAVITFSFGIAFGLFAQALRLSELIYLSFFVIVGSFAFYLGSSEGLAGGVGNAFIHFSTYPTRIFKGWTRVILFTIIPAGFIAEVPVDLIRRFTVQDLITLVGAAVVFAVIATGLFHRGLKRYESGNLISLRS